MKVIKLLYKSKNWTQGTFAKDEAGNPCNPFSKAATCFCLLGAFNKCYKEDPDYEAKLNKLYEDLKEKTGFTSVVDWNDSKKRTFKEVKALLKELDV